MELRYISEFLVLAEKCHYSDAADKLYISQSSLTRHIQSLEDELGVQLFGKMGRNVKLSIYGEQFFPYAKKFVELNRECLVDMRYMEDGVNNTLVIGVIPSNNYYGMFEPIADFQRNNTHFTLNIVEADTLCLLDMIRNDTCDFAFVRGTDDDTQEFCYMDIVDEDIVVLVSRKSALAKADTISLADLRDQQFITLSKQSFLYQFVVDACQKVGFEPQIALSATRAITRQIATERGDGVTLLPRQAAMRYITNNMHLIELNPPLVTKFRLVYAKRKKLSMAGKKFIKDIGETIAQLQEELGKKAKSEHTTGTHP